MIGNIKETFPPKTGMWKKTTSCKIQGMSKVLKVHAACNLQEIPHAEGVKRNKNKKIDSI